MADFDVNELRRIPSFYDSDDHFNGGNKLEPNPCNKRYEYKDVNCENEKFTKIKQEFTSVYTFENCSLDGSKISWGKLNYVKISECNAVKSSFSQIELSWGEGIKDSRLENCKIRNIKIHNMPMHRSAFIDSKFEESIYLNHITLNECILEKNEADDFGGAAIKLSSNKVTDLFVSALSFQIVYSKNNKYSDVCISHGRIKDGKFIGDQLEKIKLTNVKFQKCYFKDIDFSSVDFEDCTFIDCLFDDCIYTETQGKLLGMI